MRSRHPFENRYCAPCKQTTKHQVKDSQFICQRCGSIKRLVKLNPKEARGIDVITPPTPMAFSGLEGSDDSAMAAMKG